MTEITAYQCVCGKVYAKKQSCKVHENKCFSNPNTRSCITCLKFTPSNNDAEKRVCGMGIDLDEKLRTQCPDYEEWTEESFEKRFIGLN